MLIIEKINNYITDYLDKIFVGKRKKYSLFVVAVIDSVIGILPADLITVYYYLRAKKASVWLQPIFMAIGSVIGGAVLYFLGSIILDLFPTIVDSDYYLKIAEIVKYSLWLQFVVVAFFAFSSVVPFTVLSIFLGAFDIAFGFIFAPAAFLGRFLRFFLIAVLTREYGIESLKFLKKNIK
jgi:membrane protein YqaA with SNARE-associated domain